MCVLKDHIRNLARALARFARASDGNIAITFAIALIPMLAFVGAAVDFSRANSIKASMQAALDATALMVSKNAASLTSAQVQTAAQAYFLAMFMRPEATNIKITASYSSSGGSNVLVTGSTDMTTYFMAILGYKTITVTGTSTAKWGSARLRVALVLDTTGSMASDGKIDALKTATKNLLTQMQNAASTNGDVYVSIIPFSRNVNLDPANFNANWIDWTDWESEPPILKSSKPSNWSSIGPGDSCPFSSSSYGFRCTTGPTNNSPTTSSIPSSGSYSGYICPDVDGGNKDSSQLGIYYNGCYNSVPTTTIITKTIDTGRYASCGNTSNCSCSGSGSSRICTQTITTIGDPYTHTWIKNSHNTWNGCVADRGNSSGPLSDYDRLVTAPSTSITATLFPAEQNSYCSPIVTGLSYDWASMKAQVDNLSPQGATNQPIGLVWGWQSLVGGGPLTAPAKDSNYTYTDVIILLSDGLNTQDRWYGNGSTTNTSVDARMYDSSGKGTCANIKATGVTIYAIQVNTGGDPTSTLLQNCATAPDKFFLLTSATQIITTFDAIGTNLTKLRIAQ
jgi:Flp pilus assembly protein TadG